MGKVLKGRVIKRTPTHVLVDIGFKAEGVIPNEEFADPEALEALEPGSEIETMLETTDIKDGYVVLSKKRADGVRAIEDLDKAFASGADGHRPGRREDPGRLQRRRRPAGLPARVPRRHPPGPGPRRARRPDPEVPGHQVRPQDRERRPVAQARAPGRAGEEEEARLRRPRQGRPGHGARQVPDQFRRLRRPRRHRGPPPRLGHLLGQERPPLRAPGRRPGGRGRRPRLQREGREDLARPEAAPRPTPGPTSPRSTRPARRSAARSPA